MTQQAPKNLREFLEQACATVHNWEAKGQEALAVNKVDDYRQCMLEKAKFLASLERQGQAFIPSLSAAQKAQVQDRLRAFSASAMNAISLNSVFYMSALLYPEDYVQGQPNDLDLFTQGFSQ